MLLENLADKTSHSPKINLWGCISARGVGTSIPFYETLDGGFYVQILKEGLIESRDLLYPDGDWYFQQDNARSHTDRRVERWLFAKNIPLIVMPLYSPDLNPIELVWAKLKPLVHNRFPKSLEQLHSRRMECS